MGLKNRFRTILAAAAVLLASPGLTQQAHAYTQTVLYPSCASGSCPGDYFTSVMKSGTHLYGTAGGGSHGGGLIWVYGLNTGVYEVLYDFCATLHGSVCTDGENPVGPLIVDTAGNLYGVTAAGGNESPYYKDAGTVFELVKPATAHGTWTLVELYTFCTGYSGSGNCTDGANPQSGLTYAGASSGTAYDGTSLLFGTTSAGPGSGVSQGGGAVYALKNFGTSWSEKVIHVFCGGCSIGCTVCGGGIAPSGQFDMNASSNRISGATLAGGLNNSGTVYQIWPSGDLWADPWNGKVIYNFCWTATAKCSDGLTPNGVLRDATTGDLYGTTRQGGNGPAGAGNGVFFTLENITPACDEGTGVGHFWCETVGHNFCSQTNCADGDAPTGAIAMDSGTGDIFGTTSAGGSTTLSGGSGVVWKQNGSTKSTIYTFCSAGGCADGSDPLGGVILGPTGTLYGTTFLGGNSNQGTVYSLAP